jgi:hypothetical protein
MHGDFVNWPGRNPLADLVRPAPQHAAHHAGGRHLGMLDEAADTDHNMLFMEAMRRKRDVVNKVHVGAAEGYRSGVNPR